MMTHPRESKTNQEKDFHSLISEMKIDYCLNYSSASGKWYGLLGSYDGNDRFTHESKSLDEVMLKMLKHLHSLTSKRNTK